MDLTPSQQQIVDRFCANEMRELKKICYPKIRRVCGDSNMDDDDIYSIAMDVLMDSVRRYDDSQGKFESFLSNNIQNKINTYIRDTKYRNKRSNVQKDENGKNIYVPNIPIDAPTDEGINIVERIDSGFQIEEELPEEIGFSLGENVREYLDTLSETQKNIAQMFIQGYKPEEIKSELKLTDDKYNRCLSVMQKPEKRRLLKKKIIHVEEDNQMQTQTREKSKEKQYSIASLIKKMDGYTFRFDHPTQRASGRWTSQMKSNLISDILQNNPLPHLIFAEQIINEVAITWNLDGKQKSTNAYDFYNNKFRINKNVRRWNIEYQTKQRDDGGQVVLHNSVPVLENHTCDIRGKKFKDLPAELQERFLDYTFQCTQYLNCSDEDIEYHICRYNEGVRPNGSEKGMGEIGTKYAAFIKEIASMPFFAERGGYKVSEFNNGTMNRIIVESIMSIYFMDDWKKKPEDMCSFMKENVKEETFEEFTDLVERLNAVITDDVCEMFDSKDSFIWFAMFAKFIKLNVKDSLFIDFMREFPTTLSKKVIDSVTYEDLCINKETGRQKATKDKSVIVPKLNYLEKLMYEYLHINIEEKDLNTEEHLVTEIDIISADSVSVLDFVRENVDEKLNSDDVELYEESLDDYTIEIDESAKQIVDEHVKSFVALVAYAYHKEEDDKIPDWLVDYTNRITTYERNQKENYLHMKQDFEDYITKKGVVA